MSRLKRAHDDADTHAGAGEVRLDLVDAVVTGALAGVFGLVALHAGGSLGQFLSTKPVISRPKPVMLGILRGLAEQAHLADAQRAQDLRADAEQARVPLRGGAVVAAVEAGEQLAAGHRAVEQHDHAGLGCGQGRERLIDREGVVAAAGVEEVEHRDGLMDPHKGFEQSGRMSPWDMAKCTSPQVLSSKAVRRKRPWAGVHGLLG